MPTLTDQLLEAHVQHQLSRCRPAALSVAIASWLSEMFQWFGEVKLDDVVRPEQIVGVIERYVIELRVGGGIPELSGEMSRAVFESGIAAVTRVDEVMTEASYREFSDKIFALERARHELVGRLAHNTAASMISARLLARALTSLLVPALARPGKSKLSKLLAALQGRITPRLEGLVADTLTALLEQHMESFDRRFEAELHELWDANRMLAVVDELWESVRSLSLSEAFAFIEEQDLEDFVVLVYEFWQRYRKTAFFRHISSELVNCFFAKYGQESLRTLIDDMGVTEAMVRNELQEFLGPIMERAERTGLLERQVRASLEAFYRSPEASALLNPPA